MIEYFGEKREGLIKENHVKKKGYLKLQEKKQKNCLESHGLTMKPIKL